VRQRRSLDFVSLVLAPAGIGVILLAQVLDGVPLGALVQAIPALIVFGGTVGALSVTYRPGELKEALEAAGRAFRRVDYDTDRLAASLVGLSLRAHRGGLIALESELEHLPDPLLRDGLALTIDGTPMPVLREFLAAENAARDGDDDTAARVFETAAGYAPTLGILGAVLGLMRVMDHLAAPAAIGPGIAVAFVATVYGVGVANLVLLPVAGRIRERAVRAARRRQLIVAGLLAIHERLHPRLVAQKLRSYSAEMPRIDELAARGLARARV
jgi:chemotaxis protein MotA